MRRRMLAWLTAGGLAAALLTAQAQSAPAPIDEITVILARDIITMDPQVDWTVDARRIFYNMSGYLALHDHEMVLRGELAESWEWLDDRTVRFFLRQGVTFHNGEPFDAEAVKFSLERILYDTEAGSPWRSIIGFVEDVTVVDAHTVDVRANGPLPTLVAQVGRMIMVPPGYIREFGNAHFAANPIGTGPWKFVEWVPGERVVLERFDDYWRGPAQVQRVVFRAVPETFTRMTELLTGRADIVVQVPADTAPQVEANPDTRLVSIPAMQTVYLGGNARSGPLADLRVRQAIAHAIDVDAIVEFVLGGRGRVTEGFINGFIFGADPEIARLPYDPERARALLAEAGYAPGELRLPLSFGVGRFARDREVAESVSADLEAVGIVATVSPAEWGVWQESYYADRTEGLFFMSWTATIGDPDDIFRGMDLSRSGLTYYADEAQDQLIRQQLATTDLDARQVLVSEVLTSMRDRLTLIALYDATEVYGVSNRIDWRPQPNDFILLYSVTPR